MDNKDIALTMQDNNISDNKKKKEPKKFNVIACNNCHKTGLTLIKATDSYYCKFCFDKLKKQKFKK